MSGMSEMKVQQLVTNVMNTQNNDANARLQVQVDELQSQLSSTCSLAQGGGQSTRGGEKNVKDWKSRLQKIVLYDPKRGHRSDPKKGEKMWGATRISTT